MLSIATDAPTSTNRNISAGIHSLSKTVDSEAATSGFFLFIAVPRAIIAIKPAKGINVKAPSSRFIKKLTAKTMIVQTGSDILILSKKMLSNNPKPKPAAIPMILLKSQWFLKNSSLPAWYYRFGRTQMINPEKEIVIYRSKVK